MTCNVMSRDVACDDIANRKSDILQLSSAELLCFHFESGKHKHNL